MIATAQRETRVRRLLAARGHRLNKAPARHWTRKDYGVGYQIILSTGSTYGAQVREYGLSLDEVEEYVSHLARCDFESDIRAAMQSYVGNGGDVDEMPHVYGETFQFGEADENEKAIRALIEKDDGLHMTREEAEHFIEGFAGVQELMVALLNDFSVRMTYDPDAA